VVVVASAGVGTGISYALVMGEVSPLWELPGYVLVYLPAILVLVALAVVLVGWLPRFSGVAWAMLAFCFVIAWLGSLLEPPEWVNDLSPFTHTPALPADALTLTPLLVLTGLAALGVAFGLVGLKRRDIG
jgi:ABC-2 type transport system permease protein